MFLKEAFPTAWWIRLKQSTFWSTLLMLRFMEWLTNKVTHVCDLSPTGATAKFAPTMPTKVAVAKATCGTFMLWKPSKSSRTTGTSMASGSISTALSRAATLPFVYSTSAMATWWKKRKPESLKWRCLELTTISNWFASSIRCLISTKISLPPNMSTCLTTNTLAKSTSNALLPTCSMPLTTYPTAKAKWAASTATSLSLMLLKWNFIKLMSKTLRPTLLRTSIRPFSKKWLTSSTKWKATICLATSNS